MEEFTGLQIFCFEIIFAEGLTVSWVISTGDGILYSDWMPLKLSLC